MYHNPFGYDDDGFGQFPGQRAARAGAFTRQFRCYPVSFIDRAELEQGDKIILPPSALDLLTRLNISYPMLFKLESLEGGSTHCGVLEFLAQEGHAYIPYWMMQNLGVGEGEMITIKSAILEKGNFVKFQPKSADFLSISNPKSVLEKSLRSFTCLSTGDSIPINYNGKDYWIDVLDVKPGSAVSIIETDINVDFAPPPGYVEPSVKRESTPASSSRPGRVVFGGPEASKLDSNSAGEGRKLVESSDSETDDEGDKSAPKPEVERFPGEGSVLRKTGTGRAFLPTNPPGTTTEEANEEPKPPTGDFKAFSGTGYSLRGKTVAPNQAQEAEEEPEANGTEDAKGEEEPPKFVPFGGSGRRLRD